MPANIQDVQTTYNLHCTDIGLSENAAPNLIGAVSDFKAPALVERMYNPPANGGMAREIPIGWEMMDCTFVLHIFSPEIAGWMSARKNADPSGLIFTFKQALEREVQTPGEVYQVIHEITGHIKGYDPQPAPPDGVTDVNVSLKVDKYVLSQRAGTEANPTIIQSVNTDPADPTFQVRRDGTLIDLMDNRRAALGLGSSVAAPAATP